MNKQSALYLMSHIIQKTFLKHIVPDVVFLKMRYYGRMGKKLDLKNPQTYNEKLQWLKLYDRNPQYTMLVDKYEVKKYVADVLGEEYIIPTIGVWDKFEDIDFSKLPDRFVLKCTHDSGGLVVCKNKAELDIEKAREKINKSLKRNYYWNGREWPYKNVKPRIIAEEYMEDTESNDLRDYKLMCFNGETKMTLVCSDRHSDGGVNMTFFDTDWNVLPFERCHPRVKEGFKQPVNYELMVQFAKKLASQFPFARVDFYEVDGRVYFGEITFYPGSGTAAFQPEEWDYTIGSYIKLPKKEG